MAFVFGYGSLVDRASLEASIGRAVETDDGPFPAHLRGYRRCWNVATPTTVRPEYLLTSADGAPWSGHLGWLGIESDPAAAASGAAFRVTARDLDVLDQRELSYDRIEVTAQLADVLPGGTDEAVFTYRPKPDAVERARRVGSRVTVMARYLRLLDRGFHCLGEVVYGEHVRTLPDPAPFRVAEITAAPRDPSVRNAIVDPARD